MRLAVFDQFAEVEGLAAALVPKPSPWTSCTKPRIAQIRLDRGR